MRDIFTFLSGGAIGAIIMLFVTGRRNKADRRRLFCAEMCRWRHEVRINVPDTDGISNPFVSLWFTEKVPAFVKNAKMARSAFGKNVQFNALTERLAGLNQKDWHQRHPRQVILEAMDALIDAIEQRSN